jgi:hypothetical protein
VQLSAPHALLGLWRPAPDRPDPIALLQRQELQRLPWLLPIRHGRMARNVFGCYRGSAAVMAFDLGTAPHSGQEVQLCGDAHLANFGFYASPERRLLFDLNDFDETARGPFEWSLWPGSTRCRRPGRRRRPADVHGPTARRCATSPLRPGWMYGTAGSNPTPPSRRSSTHRCAGTCRPWRSRRVSGITPRRSASTASAMPTVICRSAMHHR